MFPDLAYPYRRLIIPIWLSAFLAPGLPMVVLLLMQFRIKSFWDFNNAVLGMLYALITGSVFHVFVKWIVGGLRPHFLSVCQPEPTLAVDRGIAMPGYTAGGYLETFFTPEICTGNAADVKNALQSFPSGHTTAAFATLGFLYLYLNGKLKVYANYHPSY
jgi:diacylglycerol diphosphate phosphatase/phosphatidate phosphatase